MRLLSVLFLVMVAALISCYLYLTRIKGASSTEALTMIFNTVQKTGHYLWGKWKIFLLRRTVFCVFQDIRPFEKTVRELNVCKYFKFSNTVHMSEDILSVRFCILGISNEYRENLRDLAILMSQILHDFYIERLGAVQYPAVYTAFIQEGEVNFLVAKNAYGNILISERAYADERRDIPKNMGVIEDD